MPAEFDITAHIDGWRQLLLDTSRRNRMVNFRAGRGGGLDLVFPEAAALWDRLLGGGKFEFPWKPRPPRAAGGGPGPRRPPESPPGRRGAAPPARRGFPRAVPAIGPAAARPPARRRVRQGAQSPPRPAGA